MRLLYPSIFCIYRRVFRRFIYQRRSRRFSKKNRSTDRRLTKKKSLKRDDDFAERGVVRILASINLEIFIFSSDERRTSWYGYMIAKLIRFEILYINLNFSSRWWSGDALVENIEARRRFYKIALSKKESFKVYQRRKIDGAWRWFCGKGRGRDFVTIKREFFYFSSFERRTSWYGVIILEIIIIREIRESEDSRRRSSLPAPRWQNIYVFNVNSI